MLLSHQEVATFFLQISVMLAAALIAAAAMRRLGLPIILGELVAGILIGPTVLGALAPDFFGWLFPVSDKTQLGRDAVLKLGMVFFLFIAGLEVDLLHLRQRGLRVATTSISGIIVPFALGFGLVVFFPRLWGPAPAGNPWLLPLFM